MEFKMNKSDINDYYDVMDNNTNTTNIDRENCVNSCLVFIVVFGFGCILCMAWCAGYMVHKVFYDK
jgi:hypothetical protein